MKKFLTTVIFGILLSGLSQSINGQSVSNEDALTVASNFIKNRAPQTQAMQASPLLNQQTQLAWIIDLEPQGFMIISNSELMPPVLALILNWK